MRSMDVANMLCGEIYTIPEDAASEYQEARSVEDALNNWVGNLLSTTLSQGLGLMLDRRELFPRGDTEP